MITDMTTGSSSSHASPLVSAEPSEGRLCERRKCMASLGGEVSIRSAGSAERECWDPEEPEFGLAALEAVRLRAQLVVHEPWHERQLLDKAGV